MPRTIWKGSISFGLVNIPVKMVSAITPKEIHFNMLHAKDGARIRFKRMCATEDKEVANDDIVKGYEVASGQYVTFTDKELEAVDPEASRTIDILDFVPLASIDPAYFDKPYFLIPDKNAEKPYALLLQAIAKAKRVGIAHMVMREKQYLVALRAKEGILVMETMHHHEEMVPVDSVAQEVDTKAKVDPRQLAMAEKLIDNLSVEFDPANYKDEHRARILAMVDKKASGDQFVVQPAAKPSVRTVDLMSALERSLADVQGRVRLSQRPSRQAGKRVSGRKQPGEKPVMHAVAKGEQSKTGKAAKKRAAPR